MEKRYGDSPEMGEAYIRVARLLEASGDCPKALAVYRLYMVKAAKHASRNEVAARVKKLTADPKCAN